MESETFISEGFQSQNLGAFGEMLNKVNPAFLMRYPKRGVLLGR